MVILYICIKLGDIMELVFFFEFYDEILFGFNVVGYVVYLNF